VYIYYLNHSPPHQYRNSKQIFTGKKAPNLSMLGEHMKGNMRFSVGLWTVSSSMLEVTPGRPPCIKSVHVQPCNKSHPPCNKIQPYHQGCFRYMGKQCALPGRNAYAVFGRFINGHLLGAGGDSRASTLHHKCPTLQ